MKANFLSHSSASMLESLVGRDRMDGERKGSNQNFGFQGIFNVLTTSNSRLKVHLEGDESAWADRLVIIRFDTPFKGERIDGIDEILLRNEGSGILNWALQGLADLIREMGENHGKLKLSEKQQERVANLLLESDSLRVFLRQSVQLVEGSQKVRGPVRG